MTEPVALHRAAVVLAVASLSGACAGVKPSLPARVDTRPAPGGPTAERLILQPAPAAAPGEVPARPGRDSREAAGSEAAFDLTTGILVFEGLAPEQLASIRVIAEEGGVLFEPTNGTFTGVDGFWRRGERRWFKVPGGTRVSVRRAEAGAADLVADGLSFEGTASAASMLYQQLKGQAAAAGWQPDRGASAHPTDYPF